jgi:hypothetical protein
MAGSSTRALRPLEIDVSSEYLAYWKCAAALDPVPPTWAGPTWAELLSAPVDPDGSFITVLFPASFLDRFRSRDEKQTMHMLVPNIITNHALHILERHGLQRIPLNYAREDKRKNESDDDIPF